ncbi:pentatricopeptide repeat-containing protein At1g71210, mitochondrial-like [Lotus japonicus]|uniref:pentatricopeptide repeat-containing protein At1g71210, mitochondrial-like n=1 Tax=Lotus japonicus TaxID=34305 RepID=UPI00258CD633|nr:pentatricopeptide repeat-containing protein At1g71210, mitochondrial-like [Lotus japonicus]
MMLSTLKHHHHVTKHKPNSLFSSILTLFSNNCSSLSPSSSSSFPPPSFAISKTDVADTINTWFTTRHQSQDPLLIRIYNILSSDDDFSAALSALSLPLSETFVLRVLRHGGDDGDILSCLKFFDWAGRQPRFYHTRTTFVAIFRILSCARLRPLVFDFLRDFRSCSFPHRARYHDTLVVGYAIAGKPDIALHLLGRMRFQGLDLDGFGYHILLNSLAENNCYNAFDVIANQICMRGYESHMTNVIVIKHLCKQGRLEEAEAHLNGLVGSGKELHRSELSFLIGVLCESNRFERAVELVSEFGTSLPLENAYGVWIRGLVQGGRLDEALEFFRQKRDSEGFVPCKVRYNILIGRLLRENRLKDVYELLMDMNETCIPPNMVTMNAVLCFFCKLGMVDVALELFNSRSQFGLSPNYMAYKYLILTLCWDGCPKEAYRVLRSSSGTGYFPDRRTFSTLANALCRECKIDEMWDLLDFALERRFMPNSSTYSRFVSALCRAGRVEDGYLMRGDLDKVTARFSYAKMIMGFIKSNRGDIAARLLVEMKEKGYELKRSSYRHVLHCLLHMDNPRTRFFNLLEMMTHGKPHCDIFNSFIDGAMHANKPDLAREVFELMQRNGIMTNASSQILVMKSYFRSRRISDALRFFNDIRHQVVVSTKLYNRMIVGLCKSDKADIALELCFEMLKVGLNPSIECYEVLVQKLCSLKRYYEAVNLVNVYEKAGRRLTSFLGNVLLFHSMISPEVYHSCVDLRREKEGEFLDSSMLTLIIGAFSGCLRVSYSIQELEELIAKCFPVDIYTYNLLMRKLTHHDMDKACELFDRMCQRGLEPNRWTYGLMAHGFSNHGRKDEAKRWVHEMLKKGFNPPENTRNVI